MSGIFGVLMMTGQPVIESELTSMARVLERRGPERSGIWNAGTTALGHTLLATTAEATAEFLPLVHQLTGAAITGDVRLDNREELISGLKLTARSKEIGDTEIVLHAYLSWGKKCASRLIGDFVFAIWDPREEWLFCVRDRFGMRPFNYYYSPGRAFVFASEAKAVLESTQTKSQINKARIGDFLVGSLEGIDKSTSFFEDVYRLPPSHLLTVSRRGFDMEKYYFLEPKSILRLRSDEEYAEAFLEVFTESVRVRLRGTDAVGSMLSGGLDSSSVTVVASRLLARDGKGPLKVFSAIDTSREDCRETECISSVQGLPGLDPLVVNLADFADLFPDLAKGLEEADDPFDCHMTILRAIYLLARKSGVKVVLDGGAGDVVLNSSGYLPLLIKQGRVLKATSEIFAQRRFWGHEFGVIMEMTAAIRGALGPPWFREFYQGIMEGRRYRNSLRNSAIDPSFAVSIDLRSRLRTATKRRSSELMQSWQWQRVFTLDDPKLVAGRERYDRIASSVGVEHRDPFLDQRLVEFCLRLPMDQIEQRGWPKIILRRAMKGLLPETVTWRRGKDHLGWAFTRAMIEKMEEDRSSFSKYGQLSAEILSMIDKSVVEEFEDPKRFRGSVPQEKKHEINMLSVWYERFRRVL